jgi:hypothetical protein
MPAGGRWAVSPPCAGARFGHLSATHLGELPGLRGSAALYVRIKDVSNRYGTFLRVANRQRGR